MVQWIIFSFIFIQYIQILLYPQFLFLLTLGSKSREVFQFAYWKLLQLLLTNRLEQVKQVFYRSIKMIKPNINQFNCQKHNVPSHNDWGRCISHVRRWGSSVGMTQKVLHIYITMYIQVIFQKQIFPLIIIYLCNISTFIGTEGGVSEKGIT